MQVSLHTLAAGHARMQRARKRVRVLRAPRPNRATELWYKSQLLMIVKQLSSAVENNLLPMLKQYEPQYLKKTGDAYQAADGMASDLSGRITDIADGFGGMRRTAQRLAELAAQKAQADTDAQLTATIQRSIGVDLTGILSDASIKDVIESAVVRNVDLITSIPEQYFGKVRSAVTEGVQDGLRWEDIAAKIQEATDATESRAKFIARDQVSKMNAAVNETRQTDLGIDSYIWSGAMDERERESHADNEGKQFRWDDPPATGHPGEDYNCRCVALPVFDLDKQEKDLGL